MIRILYKRILKPLLFLTDPDWIHNVFVSMGELLGKYSITRGLISWMYRYQGPDVSTTIDGITYPTPIVLAAGFDYNGRLAGVLDGLSFGGDEIGSVTARPCKGNEPPRLKRMIRSQSLVVYKGLKNEGVDAVIERLKKTRKPPGFVWGISIAKTNDAQSAGNEAAIEDYCYSLRRLVEENIGDFYTINISCPNVHGGESFADAAHLRPLMERLMQIKHNKPVYAKMPINSTWEEFNQMLEVLDACGAHGVVIGNLNKIYSEADFPEEAPENYRGGLSGKTCQLRSNELIRKKKKKWGTRFTIFGCGGVLSTRDALEKLDAGADAVQLITGMIFEGPHLMRDICRALAERKK